MMMDFNQVYSKYLISKRNYFIPSLFTSPQLYNICTRISILLLTILLCHCLACLKINPNSSVTADAGKALKAGLGLVCVCKYHTFTIYLYQAALYSWIRKTAKSSSWQVMTKTSSLVQHNTWCWYWVKLSHSLTNISIHCSPQLLWWVHAPLDHFRTLHIHYNKRYGGKKYTLLHCLDRSDCFIHCPLPFLHSFFPVFLCCYHKCCPSQGCNQSCGLRLSYMEEQIMFRCAGGGKDQVKVGLRWGFPFGLNGADSFKMADRNSEANENYFLK